MRNQHSLPSRQHDDLAKCLFVCFPRLPPSSPCSALLRRRRTVRPSPGSNCRRTSIRLSGARVRRALAIAQNSQVQLQDFDERFPASSPIYIYFSNSISISLCKRNTSALYCPKFSVVEHSGTSALYCPKFSVVEHPGTLKTAQKLLRESVDPPQIRPGTGASPGRPPSASARSGSTRRRECAAHRCPSHYL